MVTDLALLENLRVEKYEQKVLSLDVVFHGYAERRKILYGIQPAENSRIANPTGKEFDRSTIIEMSEQMKIIGYPHSQFKPVRIVMLKGTPVVVDGHHRMRALGLYNSYCRTHKVPYPDLVEVETVDLNDYLSKMQWSEEQFLFLVRYAAGTFVEAMSRSQNLFGKVDRGIPIMPFYENLGLGISEQ